jgi:hypothetical protein
MTNVSLVKDGVTFTFQDGTVDSVEVQKQAQLDENTLPASDSNDAFILDFNGVKKGIVINGFIFDDGTNRTSSGTTVTIEAQMDWLMAIVDGSQSGITFNSTYQTGKTVYVRSVSFVEKSGNPLRVEFRMDFVEGM